MATQGISQDELLRECAEQIEKVDRDARRLAGDLTADQMQWSPPDGGWSIAQVFTHLATANGSYLDGVRSAIERDRASAGPRGHDLWKPSFLGGMLIRSMEPSSKRGMPSPRIWRPAAEQPSGSLEAFLQTQAVIADLIRSAEGIDLVRARLSSPVSRFIRINVGDAFKIFVVHDWRHLGQIRRVIERDGFPPGSPHEEAELAPPRRSGQ